MTDKLLDTEYVQKQSQRSMRQRGAHTHIYIHDIQSDGNKNPLSLSGALKTSKSVKNS
jgi:hypothetical protein